MKYKVNQDQIRKSIRDSGITFTALAKRLGFSTRTLYNKLDDPDGRLWRATDLTELACVVGASPGDFFTLKLE